MEFGDKEWFEKIESLLDFPVVLGFYVTNEERSIESVEIKTKAFNVWDIKYSKVAPFGELDNGEKLALVKVGRVRSANHYYETAKELHEIWKGA